jgi:hypothetical protein
MAEQATRNVVVGCMVYSSESMPWLVGMLLCGAYFYMVLS